MSTKMYVRFVLMTKGIERSYVLSKSIKTFWLLRTHESSNEAIMCLDEPSLRCDDLVPVSSHSPGFLIDLRKFLS